MKNDTEGKDSEFVFKYEDMFPKGVFASLYPVFSKALLNHHEYSVSFGEYDGKKGEQVDPDKKLFDFLSGQQLDGPIDSSYMEKLKKQLDELANEIVSPAVPLFKQLPQNTAPKTSWGSQAVVDSWVEFLMSQMQSTPSCEIPIIAINLPAPKYTQDLKSVMHSYYVVTGKEIDFNYNPVSGMVTCSLKGLVSPKGSIGLVIAHKWANLIHDVLGSGVATKHIFSKTWLQQNSTVPTKLNIVDVLLVQNEYKKMFGKTVHMLPSPGEAWIVTAIKDQSSKEDVVDKWNPLGIPLPKPIQVEASAPHKSPLGHPFYVVDSLSGSGKKYVLVQINIAGAKAVHIQVRCKPLMIDGLDPNCKRQWGYAASFPSNIPSTIINYGLNMTQHLPVVTLNGGATYPSYILAQIRPEAGNKVTWQIAAPGAPGANRPYGFTVTDIIPPHVHKVLDYIISLSKQGAS